MRIVLKILHFAHSIWASLAFLFILILGVLGYIFVAIFIKKNVERNFLRVNNIIAFLWSLLTGVRFKTYFNPAISKTQSYVFISNHTSSLDALILSYSLRYGVRALAKKELKNIPLLGFLFRLTSIFVDRSDKGSRSESLQQMKEIAARGVSLLVFPEGTRNRSSRPLNKFYNGAFKMAVHAQIPIAPMVVVNARVLMPGNSYFLKPGTVSCYFLDPIPTTGLTEANIPDLKERAFNTMYEELLKRSVLAEEWEKDANKLETETKV